MLRDELVLLFMKKAENYYNEFPHMQPPMDKIKLCRALIKEESHTEMEVAFDKCEKAWTIENVQELLDTFADAMYVVIFAAETFGLPLNEAWEAVCEANLAKVRNGVIRNEAGKIQKPAGWTPPDIWKITNECFANSQSRWNHARPFNSPNQDGK